MAGVTALRDAARAAIMSAGGRGFVRFLLDGDALLISDAPRRCEDGDALERIIAALEASGFSCEIEDGLAAITPARERMLALCEAQPEEIAVDWDGALFEAQALCARLLRAPQLEIGEAGFRLMLQAARLLWQPQDKLLSGLPLLRAQIAAMLRRGERGGLHETGRLLCGRLAEGQ